MVSSEQMFLEDNCPVFSKIVAFFKTSVIFTAENDTSECTTNVRK